MDKSVIARQVNEYVFDGQFIGQFARDVIIKKYLKAIKDKQIEPVVLEEQGAEIYFSWSRQPWDSEKLQRQVKRIDFISYNVRNKIQLKRIISHLSDSDLLYLRLNRNHPLLPDIVNNDFGLLEYAEKIMLKLLLKEDRLLKYSHKVRFFSDLKLANKESMIKNIAKDAFATNRFKRDPKIPEQFVGLVYTSWLENYLDEPDNILCFVEESNIYGFVLFTKNSNQDLEYGFIDLIAVDTKFQNKSVASALLDTVNNNLLKDGIKVLYANVDSQNKPAISFFKKQGFEQFNALKEYHWWR